MKTNTAGPGKPLDLIACVGLLCLTLLAKIVNSLWFLYVSLFCLQLWMLIEAQVVF